MSNLRRQGYNKNSKVLNDILYIIRTENNGKLSASQAYSQIKLLLRSYG